MTTNKARVFISCGQKKDSDEAAIATAVANEVRDLGFEPYVATARQSLRALRENIFQELTNTEYFLFIDFRRERLGDLDPPEYRGSLFSHQELAIASFQEIELPI